MSHLIPCPSCARHVRQSEASCPFCSSELALGHVPPPVLPRGRLSRAATLAFGAGLVSATSLVGCSGTTEEGKEGGGGSESSAGNNSAGNNSAGNNSAGNGSGGTGVSVPVYGAPSGGNFSIGGMYGGAPAMGGGGPAGAGSGGNAGSGGGAGDASAGSAGTGQAGPVYGAPPAPQD